MSRYSVHKQIPIKVEKIHVDAVIPSYESEDAAGFDLFVVEGCELDEGESTILGTGLKMEIPRGYEVQVRPRSGWSIKTKLRISNSPGTVDADYRGEVGIIVENNGVESILINKGDRVAQGVLNQVPQALFFEGDLSETERGKGGFGHTGK